MSSDKKIELRDLLEHVRQQRKNQWEAGLHLFGVCEGTGRSAWCRLVVDGLTDGVRETVAKMQVVAHCVLGLKLEVLIYSLSDQLEYCPDAVVGDREPVRDIC